MGSIFFSFLRQYIQKEKLPKFSLFFFSFLKKFLFEHLVSYIRYITCTFRSQAEKKQTKHFQDSLNSLYISEKDGKYIYINELFKLTNNPLQNMILFIEKYTSDKVLAPTKQISKDQYKKKKCFILIP